ncbi:hypothetical protein ECE50_018330 [Chitinophaga sp. Mgbs1]|uniref:Uncharacterized protein n=1 Tax=Chitinophaga solisilvae TaxID=1233460 RepID=A0A3S1CY74_9BACT|nr:hypothetical protein [Chitinophaga solisilvae]
MTKSIENPKVDWYFSEAEKWQEELDQLRMIILECGLTETLKWGVPCYTFQDRNILLVHTFKEYCAILFMKGALMPDSHGILIQQTENVQAARQIRFTNPREIVKMKSVLRNYIYEAIEIEKSGVEVPKKKTAEFPMPEEFKNILDKNAALKKAFEALTPGRQRGYLLHFAAPKQSKTREARIEKSMQDILNGKGLNDE